MSKPAGNPLDRLWRYIERAADGCWLWRGARHPQGYGIFQFWHEGKWQNTLAHKAAWIMYKGEIPKEKLPTGRRVWRVSQTCDNKLCVNPAHLSLREQYEVVEKREQLAPKEGKSMRDIQLQSGKSLTYSLPIKLRKKELFCTCCANDCAKALADLHGVRVEVFPMLLLNYADRCVKCNLRTGNLYEVREV